MRRDKIGIILGVTLLAASFFSYFMIEAYGQQDFELDCPKNAYHGIDNQGNETCRDILSNQILKLESMIVTDLNSEKITELDSQIIIISDTEDITINDEQTGIVEITILVLIGIVGSIIWASTKKRKLIVFQRRGWNSVQKKQVKDRQFGKCNICFTPPTKWKYDYFDGNKNNNNLDNCQALCSDCYSVKTQKNNQELLN
ncbi:MAG TPA: hypothetical protein OQH54_05290 [Nitrosopumilus sp.]|nr:hypothetical protein [Thermoproteota archaeon]HJJ23113.1 hypothetical protein [Nitrosopumilus sp.]